MAFGNPMYNNMYGQNPYYNNISNGAVPDTLNQFKYPYQQQQQIANQQPNYQMPNVPNANFQNNFNSNSSGIIWVQGENAAKSYQVVPGNSVMLFDSEAQVFYLKSVDASGMPMALKIFDYTERKENNTPNNVLTQNQISFDPDKYVTREELEDRLSKITSYKTLPVDNTVNKSTKKNVSNKDAEVISENA